MSQVEEGRSLQMLEHYLAPLAPYLARKDLTEVTINRPGEIWTEGANGWEKHAAPDVGYKSCLHLATLIASANDKKITKDGDKSMSWSPNEIRTRPPVLLSSLFSTGFRIGS